jgi:integrase
MQRKPNGDLFKRHATRHRGISHRVRSDGSRAYSVYWRGKYVPAGRTEGEALAKQAELRRAHARGERIVLAHQAPRFAEFSATWFETKRPRLRTSTARDYRASLDLVLLARFGDWRLSDIDADAISKLVRDLEAKGLNAIDAKRTAKQLSASTIENHLKPLRGTLALAVRRGLIATNPFSQLVSDDRPQKSKRKQTYDWSEEEIGVLLSGARKVAARPDAKYDYTNVLYLTERLGLRLGEVTGLRWEDFDKTARTLRVERQWTRWGEYGPTKTPAGVRTLPLSDDLVRFLVALRLKTPHSRDSDPIFASRNGTPLNHRNTTRRGFEQAAKTAGIEGVSFHDLRHAAASRLIDAGLSPVAVADFLGHEDSTVTLRVYAHVWNRQKTDEAVRAAMTRAPK